MCLIPNLSNLHDSVMYLLVDVYFLLADEVFKTKTKTLKPILFNFTFEIVLACSYSSLRTISGTTSLAPLPGTKIKIIFPGKNHNDIDLTLDGRQEKDIEIDCNHLPGDSTIKDSTARRIVLTEK